MINHLYSIEYAAEEGWAINRFSPWDWKDSCPFEVCGDEMIDAKYPG
jgi:hypothetical protein